MKPIAILVPVALLAALAAGAIAVQDPPEPTKTDEHRWLQQLVGEWSATAEMTMEPGGEPMSMESTESARSIGDLWVVAEGEADFGGNPFRSIMTLGYDPDREAFVGTWIDSVQTHLWVYEGRLDEERKVLTLETEGPAFGEPGKTASYRDAIRIEGKDHKVLTSSIRVEDGDWVTFLRADYRRRK